jgi:hypothetical protein
MSLGLLRGLADREHIEIEGIIYLSYIVIRTIDRACRL